MQKYEQHTLIFRLDEYSSKLTHLATGNNKQIVKNNESIAKLEALVEDLQEKVDLAAKIGEELQKKVGQDIEIGKKLMGIVATESIHIKRTERNFQKKLDCIEEKIVVTLERLEGKIRANHELAD